MLSRPARDADHGAMCDFATCAAVPSALHQLVITPGEQKGAERNQFRLKVEVGGQRQTDGSLPWIEGHHEMLAQFRLPIFEDQCL